MLERGPCLFTPARWISWAGHFVALLLALAAFVCCQREAPLDLLQVSAVLPAEAQFGDAVQVVGDGFALGNSPTVTLRGEVYRAGQAPVAVEASFHAETDSQRELSVQLVRDLQEEFCGGPETASHATFRGDVQVAIAAKAPGAPPVTGTLHGAVLELYPAVRTQIAEDRQAALGREVLAFLGVEVARADAGGLSVIRVAPGSRAVAADLRPGDRLVRAGGVSVLQPSDLMPEPARVFEVGVMRAEVEHSLLVDADGFSPRPPASLQWGALLVGVVALGLVFFASPATRVLAWLTQNFVAHRRLHVRVTSRQLSQPRPEASSVGLIHRLGGGIGLIVWFGIAAALFSPLLRRGAIDLTLGLLTVMFGSAALLGVWQLVRGGRVGPRWSLLKGMRAALLHCVITAPGWLAVLSTCFETGVDFDDMVRAQGVAPWNWNAFANPGLLVLFVLLLLTALPRFGRSAGHLAGARPLRISWGGRRDSLLGWLYLCSMSAVAAIAFLGGDAWPGELSSSSRTWFVPSFASSLVLVTKYTALVLAVAFLRALCLNVTVEQWGPVSLRICLPLAALAVGVAHAWRSLDAFPPFWHWVKEGFGPISVVAAVLGGAVLAWRVSSHLRRSSPPALSPWI